VETHRQVLRILADGERHSGAELARALGVSRVAVWKAVRKAETSLGLPIETQRGRGYRLRAPLDLLDSARILEAIEPSQRRHLARIEIHDEIDSTNSHLMRAARSGAPSGTLCLAERQSAGRGRHGRTWVSPYGSNLYLSLLWRFEQGPAQLGGLSLAAGTAIANALSAEGVTEVGLKWPNDVLWRGRKLAGLLLELAGEATGPSQVVIGVGVNTRLGAAGAAIEQPWTDLDQVLGPQAHDRNRLAGRVAAQLLAAVARYAQDGLSPFIGQWEARDSYLGAPVELRLGDRRIIGSHAGINEQGALRLATVAGVETFLAGEVSLRPQIGTPR
jgi:BirA family biotin operon repressor/biotin-[acetyl-CoA-carboxylase] ligase